MIRTAKGWSRDRWTEYIRKEVAKGSYSAIVYIDGSTVYAEDAEGNTIAQGEAGVDDASVIQSAMDGGGKIFIKKGTYIIDLALLPKSNTILEGEGFETILKKKDYATDGAFNAEVIRNPEVGSNNVVIRNLGIDGNKANQNPTIWYSYIGIYIGRGVEWFIENCYIKNCYAGGIYLESENVYNITVIKNILEDNGTSVSNRSGIELDGANKCNILYNICKSNYGHGILILSSSNRGIQNKVIGNTCIADGRSGIQNYSLSLVDTYNLIALNKIFDSNSTSEAGIQAWKTKKNIIALNSVINSSYIGILVYGDYNKVFANVTESNATAGVRIVGGNGNRVEHNIILDSFPYWSGGTNTIVKNNIGYTTESSGTQTFDGDGTTTKFTIAHGLVSTPSNVQVTPRSADAAGDFYVTVDDTNIYVNYSSAPPSGSDNVVLGWEAEV